MDLEREEDGSQRRRLSSMARSEMRARAIGRRSVGASKGRSSPICGRKQGLVRLTAWFKHGVVPRASLAI